MLDDTELLKISDIMGEVVHNKWMEHRAKEKGWHNPENCHNRLLTVVCNSCESYKGKAGNNVICGKFGYIAPRFHDGNALQPLCDKYEFKPCPQCHSCMRPYTELPDFEKELDRQYLREFIKALELLGYEIVKK